MPIIATGALDLESSFELYELGPERGQPVTIHWPWTNHLWSILPLGLLALPLLLRRNRNRGAAAIWLPVLAIYYSWLPLYWAFGNLNPQLEVALGVFAVGLGVTCTLVPWIATGPRWRNWLLALISTLAVEALALALFSAGALELFSATGVPVVMPAMVTGIVVTSAALAGRAFQGQTSSGRFLARFLLWLLLSACATVIAIAIAQEAVVEASGFDAFLFLISALMMSIIALVSVAPFLLLARFSETYRERFRVALERG